jgi:hypothetical protein
MSHPKKLEDIDLTPIPGKKYYSIEREWREEFIYFLMVDRFHDDLVRQPNSPCASVACTTGRSPGAGCTSAYPMARPTRWLSPASCTRRRSWWPTTFPANHGKILSLLTLTCIPKETRCPTSMATRERLKSRTIRRTVLVPSSSSSAWPPISSLFCSRQILG